MRSKILATSLMVVALASAAAAPAPACFAADATSSAPDDAASQADFQQWLATFRRDASAQGIDQSTLDLAFRGVTPDPSVQKLDSEQPEFITPIWEYLAKRLSAENIQQGQQLLRSVPALPEVERVYGVDARIVAAIWCAESD